MTLSMQLLGVPTLAVDGVSIRLPTRKSVAIMAFLACEERTPRARIAEMLWPDSTLGRARGNLRRELNRLRNQLPEDVLATTTTELALEADIDCDVIEFRAHIAAADLDPALALYRGPFLEGLEFAGSEFENWLLQTRHALEESYRSALVTRAQADERAGDLRAALERYLRLIALDETQESYYAAAMRLHYSVGERERAMARFAELKRVLRRELALVPLPETIELFKTIQAARPLEPTPAAPVASSVIRPSLVGREMELERVAASRHPVVVVTGEPGIGKSSLVMSAGAQFPAMLVVRGSEVATGSLTPFSDALDAFLDTPMGRALIGSLPIEAKRSASRLLPGLSEHARESDEHESRSYFLESLVQIVSRALEPRGVLVAEDIHCYDEQSIELLFRLAKQATQTKIRILATARSAELEGTAASRLIDELRGNGLVDELELEGLSPAVVYTIVERALDGRVQGKELENLAARVTTLTRGNPLFVGEILRELALVDLRQLSDLPMPSSIRELVTGQVTRMNAPVRRLLDAASICRQPFDLTSLGPATGLASWELVGAAELALASGVLERRGEGLAFHHDLVRRAIADALSAPRRQLIHAKLAEGLVHFDVEPALLANHLSAAGLSVRACAYQVRAGDRARSLLDFEEALRHYHAALEVAPSAAEAVSIHRRCIAIHRRLDDYAAWEAAIEKLELAARDADQWTVVDLCRAQLDNQRGSYRVALARADRVVEKARDESEVRAGVLESAKALINLGRIAEARTRLERGLETIEEGDDETAAEFHQVLFSCAYQDNDLDRASLHNAEAKRASERRGDRFGLVLATLNEGAVMRRAGELDQAWSAIQDAERQASKTGFISIQQSALLALSSIASKRGDYDSAASLAKRGISLSGGRRDPLMEARLQNALAVFDYARGLVSSSLERSQRAVELTDSIGAPAWSAFMRCGLAHTLIGLERFQQARATLELPLQQVEEQKLEGLVVAVHSLVGFTEIAFGRPGDALARISPLIERGLPNLDPDVTLAVLALAKLRCGEAAAALEVLASRSVGPLHRPRTMAIEVLANLELKREVDLEHCRKLLADESSGVLESVELWRCLIHDQTERGFEERAEQLCNQAREWASGRNSPVLADLLERRLPPWQTENPPKGPS